MMRLCFALAVVLTLAACGGSSSETPPPLQPDPAGFHYAGVSASKPEDPTDAGAEPASDDSDDEAKPKRPASSTWGGSAPKK